MLEVRLLGEAWVAAAASDQRQPSPRAMVLLARLVLTCGVAQPRQQLAGVFWPESEEAQARTNLRRELHHLRTLLGEDPSLIVTPTTLSWRDSPSCRVDVRQFLAGASAAQSARAVGDSTAFLAHAEAAIATYRGDLMPGSYDDWLLEHREALRQQCAELCGEAARAWADAGDLDRAEGLARRRISLDPLTEPAYRALMALQAEAGDRAGAMATYHRCATVLERELGVSPAPETTRSLEQLLGRGRPSAGAAAAAPRPRSSLTVGLIGRGAENHRLLGRWQAAARGDGGLVLVSGEAGVGKTRLVAELTTAAAGRGAVVATSRCFRLSGRIPLAPVADWLRTPGLSSAVRELPQPWRAEVERLVPTDATATGPRPRPARPSEGSRAMVDAWRRHRLFEGLAHAVLGSGRPTLLVLDDLQWCDDETLGWLSSLLPALAHRQVLVVATVRSDDPDESRAGPSAAQLLRWGSGVSEIALSPLEPMGAEQLAALVRGRRLSDTETAFLHATTGGFPLFVVEVARSMPEHATDAGPAPVADLSSVLRRRLEETSPAAREIAGLAAALGRDFSLDLLAEASDLAAEDLVHAVDELWRRRILREQRGGYDFSHDLLRDAAYGLVSPPRRWLLHRRLAQGLELLHSGHLDEVAAQLADQYDRGGRPDRALHYSERSAQVAEGVFANAEALRHYRRCLDLVSRLPSGRDRDGKELDVLQSMAAPLNALHGYSSPLLQEALERSAELAGRLGRRHVLVESLVGLFCTRFVQGHTALAHDIGGRALALTDGDDVDPHLAAQAHFVRAGSAVSLGLPDVAVEHFGRACALSPHGVSLVLGTRLDVHARGWAAHAHWLLGDDARAAQESRTAVAEARAADHPWSLAVALAYAAVTFQLRGELEAMRAAVAELHDTCERYEFAYYREWAVILGGWATGGPAGIAEISRGIADLRAHGSLARMPYWLCLLAEALIADHQPERASAVLDGACAVARQGDDRWWLPEVLRLRAGLQPGDAGVVLLTEALDMAEQQQSPVLGARCRADLAVRGTAGTPHRRRPHRSPVVVVSPNAARTPSP